jgi:prepilin peptidase CpaA
MLIVGIGMFARGWIGGGDAKLFAVTALWVGWDMLLEYAVVASLLGGVLTMAILFFRRVPISGLMLRFDWVARLHHNETGIPYGIALAAAGLMIYTKTYWFTGTLG